MDNATVGNHGSHGLVSPWFGNHGMLTMGLDLRQVHENKSSKTGSSVQAPPQILRTTN